jgi:glutamyl-tRNA synthetase
VLTLIGISELEGHAPIHPDNREMGIRQVKLQAENSNDIKIFIPGTEWGELKNSEIFRLKDLCNASPGEEGTIEYKGNDISVLKTGNVKIIQWASAAEHLKVELTMPDGTSIKGVGEKGIANSEGKLVQFERVGFAKVYRSEKPDFDYQAVFCHK